MPLKELVSTGDAGKAASRQVYLAPDLVKRASGARLRAAARV